MTISRAAAGAALAASLLIGAAAGRWAFPARVLERDRIVTTDREVSSSWHAYVGRTEIRERSSTRWRTVTRWHRDGSVTQTTAAAAELEQLEQRETREHSAEAREVVRYQEREVVRKLPGPDWLLGVGTGWDLGRGEVTYGVRVGRRIAGPLYLELEGRRPWAVGALLTVSF